MTTAVWDCPSDDECERESIDRKVKKKGRPSGTNHKKKMASQLKQELAPANWTMSLEESLLKARLK